MGVFLFGAGNGNSPLKSPVMALRAALRAACLGCFRSPAGQNASPERFVFPGFDSLHSQTRKRPMGVFLFGAGDGNSPLKSPVMALRAALRAACLGCFRSPAGQNASPERFVFPGFDSLHSQTRKRPMGVFLFGAGDGNRTHVIGLGSRRSTIELHPHEAY